jgi:hypothetical protein
MERDHFRITSSPLTIPTAKITEFPGTNTLHLTLKDDKLREICPPKPRVPQSRGVSSM